MSYWANNNKVRFNNYQEPFWYHEMIKTLCVLILRQKYPNSAKIPIYTEHKVGNRKADVYIDIGTDKFAIELQTRVTKAWIDKAVTDYDKLGLIFTYVDLSKMSKYYSIDVERLKISLSGI